MNPHKNFCHDVIAIPFRYRQGDAFRPGERIEYLPNDLRDRDAFRLLLSCTGETPHKLFLEKQRTRLTHVFDGKKAHCGRLGLPMTGKM